MASAIDEDTRRTLVGGRETLGAMLRAAQKHLQKVFIVFVLALVVTIWALRAFIWDQLRQDLLNSQAKVVFVTPFDVILLQLKIGLVVGAVVAVPMLLYFSRDGLRKRGYWPQTPLPWWKLGLLVIGIITLFVIGVAYAYVLFFPIMFEFLANTAVNSGFQPTYSIVMWVEFIALLGLSFGIAAQLPLVMSVLSYAEIVPYETFRDKWKHAVFGLYAAGALFTPPDPITQLMWATPLVVLYAISLKFTRIVVTIRRSSERLDLWSVVRANANVVAGTAVLAFLGVYLFFTGGGLELVNDATASLPGTFWPTFSPLGETLGVDQQIAAGALGAVAALVVAGVVAYRYISRELSGIDLQSPAPASTGDPTELDLSELDADGVRAAPYAAFEGMTEDDVLQIAQEAMNDDDPEKAQALLDEFDDAQQMLELEQSAQEYGSAPADESETEAPEDDQGPPEPPNGGAGPPEGAAGPPEPPADDSGAETGDERPDYVPENTSYTPTDTPEDSQTSDGPTSQQAPGPAGVETDQGGGDSDAGVVTETTAGVVDAFTEDDTTEEDIGGYYTDIAFILESLTSRAFRLVGLFMATLAIVFVGLYRGGIGRMQEDFTTRLPPEMSGQDVSPVALHPVEHLIFMIKFSVLVAVVVTLPLLLYYAWPALKQRGFARGDRRVLALWGGTLLGGVAAGTVIGYTQVAPAVISWLAQDTIGANMIIAYRIKHYAWLIVYTTVGIGLLAEIPVTLLLFHYGGLVSFTRVWSRWREVVIGIFAFAALVTPSGMFTMLVMAIPISLSFFLGLGLLWVFTLGGRRSREDETEPAD